MIKSGCWGYWAHFYSLLTKLSSGTHFGGYVKQNKSEYSWIGKLNYINYIFPPGLSLVQPLLFFADSQSMSSALFPAVTAGNSLHLKNYP